MDAKDLVIGQVYLYEGTPVRLVNTRVFPTAEGDRVVAIIDTGTYANLWVKPDWLTPCPDLRQAINVC